jgi:hypothetical protein
MEQFLHNKDQPKERALPIGQVENNEVKSLASRIEGELQVGEWKHCSVYEGELQCIWPLNEKDRQAKIAQFAKKYGFRLRFDSKGLCVIFDKEPAIRQKVHQRS